MPQPQEESPFQPQAFVQFLKQFIPTISRVKVKSLIVYPLLSRVNPFPTHDSTPKVRLNCSTMDSKVVPL